MQAPNCEGPALSCRVRKCLARLAALLLAATAATAAAASPSSAGPLPRVCATDTLPILGWFSNIVRRQGADSLRLLYREEAPGANAVFLGTGGLMMRRSDGGPWLAREGAPGADPNLNTATFRRALLGATDTLGLNVLLLLPTLFGPAEENPAAEDSLALLVRWALVQYRGPGRIVGWVIADEPNLGIGCPGHPDPSRFPPGWIRRARRAIRLADPDSLARPIFTVLFGCPDTPMNADSLHANFLGALFERVLVDRYVSPPGPGEEPGLSVNRPDPPSALLGLAWNVAPAFRARPVTPWIAVLQGFNISAADPGLDPWQRGAAPAGTFREADSLGSRFDVSRHSLMYQAISCLANGANGILFYGGVPRDAQTQTFPPYASTGFRRRAVAPVMRLLGGRPSGGHPSAIEALVQGRDAHGRFQVHASSDSVHWRASRARDGRYWMAVSNDAVGRAELSVRWNDADAVETAAPNGALDAAPAANLNRRGGACAGPRALVAAMKSPGRVSLPGLSAWLFMVSPR